MIRVYLADDHAVLRAGVASLIDAQTDMECVGQAANGRQLLEEMPSSDVDIAIVDLEMPDCDGLKTVELLTKTRPGVKTIVLTMHQDRRLVESSLAAGASAFVAKHVASTELLSAIRSVAEGSSFLCLVGAGPVAAPLIQHPLPEATEGLSRREKQVLEQLILGNTNREISESLGVGIKSIETYRSRIANKTGMKTRAQLVQYAIDSGLMQNLVGRIREKSS